MSNWKTELAAAGIDPGKVSDEQARAIAKTLNIDVPRAVQFVEHTNQRKQTNTFLKTEGYVVGRKDDGSPIVARGLFLRASAVPQAYEDLKAAMDLLSDQDTGEE